jgi:flavodoxin
MKAIVVYATRFRTTEKVAKSLGAGLGHAGLETDCVQAAEVEFKSLNEYDLICIGAPTETFSAYKPMKEFLERLKDVDLGGKFAFAFDTKLDSRLSGSAAKYIEGALDDQGLRIVAERESAIVTTLKQSGQIKGALLKDGEESRFEMLGRTIGEALMASPNGIPA